MQLGGIWYLIQVDWIMNDERGAQTPQFKSVYEDNNSGLELSTYDETYK